jgi:hypothetical protein
MYYNYVSRLFDKIFLSIKENNIENMISLYSDKPEVFNNICFFSQIPPAKPGACFCEPLKAVGLGAA